MTVNIQVEQNELPAFLACLGIGTLVAMQKGQLEAEAGIWTMGAPRVWEPFVEGSVVPQEVLEVFQQSDELATLQQLAPDSYEEELSRLINQLSGTLSRMQKPLWSLRWGSNEKQKEAGPAFESKKALQELIAA
jgi:hypothetical protein